MGYFASASGFHSTNTLKGYFAPAPGFLITANVGGGVVLLQPQVSTQRVLVKWEVVLLHNEGGGGLRPLRVSF